MNTGAPALRRLRAALGYFQPRPVASSLPMRHCTTTSGDLAGKRVLLTGGGTGIGKAIAMRFASEGADVVVTGRRLPPIERTVAENSGPGRIVHKQGDIADIASARDLVQFATTTLGGIDILVNNAGMNIPKRSLDELSVEDFASVVHTNLVGTFHMMHEVLPQMKIRGDGLILNVSSIAGRQVTSLAGPAYCASKFGVNALGAAATVELYESGIRVTNICPGEVETEILDRRPVPPSEEQRAKMLKPEDVAAAAAMVASLPPRAHVPELVITGRTTVERGGVPMW